MHPRNQKGKIVVDKSVIVEVLCGQALADHLGDARDEERKLWALLGIEKPQYEADSAFVNTQRTLYKHEIPLPDYLGTHEKVEAERAREGEW